MELAQCRPFLGHTCLRPRLPRLFTITLPSALPSITTTSSTRICCRSDGSMKRKAKGNIGSGEVVRVKEKEKASIWSVENDMVAKVEVTENKRIRRRTRGRPQGSVGKRRKNSKVLVSGAMLMEIETVLQTQEPVIRPAWNTFASSVCGIWKGVGAVFSPLTAEMEPIGIGKQNENLYDCYTFSCVQNSHYFGGHHSKIHRKTNWVALNPFGEIENNSFGGDKNKERNGYQHSKKQVDGYCELPSYESFNFESSEVLEEDILGMERGLVFFEDGSYSRGPMDIPVGDFDESKYFSFPTFKFEQCLIKGCHKRLRIVHTIEFSEGGSNIQIVKVAVYEEQWVSPVNLDDRCDTKCDLKSFSQRKRTQPLELTGSWKVSEMSATPILAEDESGNKGGSPYVYLCTETLKKRSLPENQLCFGEEEMLDMQEVTVLWLPGGVTGHVDVNNDGVLCIGVGWYSDEGVNLVMERDYGTDGKLKAVRWKSEVKRR